MKTPLLLLGLALACALWARAAEASTIFRAPNNLSLAQGLVGWWNFDGKTVSGTRVFDASGNGNYGTMTNGPTLIEGKNGQGMMFDGGDDYVDISDSSVFDLSASGKYTWTGWVKPASFKEWNTLIREIQSLGPDKFFAVYAGHTTTNSNFGPVTGGISVAWDSSGDGVGVQLHSTNNVMTIGVWSHVVVTYDGSLAQANRFSVYVNGANVTDTSDIASAGTISDLSASAGSINIGRDGGFGDSEQGLLDDVRVYNRALSADEIKRLYNGGR